MAFPASYDLRFFDDLSINTGGFTNEK